MRTIQVKASRSYTVSIGSNQLSRLGTLLPAQTANAKIAVISDSYVWAHYGHTVTASLSGCGHSVFSFVISPGENSKNPDNFMKILNYLSENRFSRQDCILALGGGVVGDLAGFCAASYMRGIPWVQVPTSVLAMVDSSVGGKTAINIPAGKNLVGAFYQPHGVICDPDTLQSLPRREFLDGCAEIIKYGIAFDPTLFAGLERSGANFDREKIIARCIQRKAEVVCQDEFDTGLRQLLNLGHTFGHAIEAESNYTVSHGQAVATGMAIAARAAAHMGLCSPSTRDRILSLLSRFGFSLKTVFSAQQLLEHMCSDKKSDAGGVWLILPTEIGSCTRIRIPEATLLSVIQAGL